MTDAGVPEAARKEWVEDTIRQVVLKLKRKFNRPQMKDYRIISFEEERALVEFPGLIETSKEDLEAITHDLIKTMTVLKVGAAYVGGVKVDLFDIDAKA